MTKIKKAFNLLLELLQEQREENGECEFSVAWDEVMCEYDLNDKQIEQVLYLYDFQ